MSFHSMKPEGQDWESLWKRGKVATSLRRFFLFSGIAAGDAVVRM